MKYKIFQPYYDKAQLKNLDKEFTPFNNLENARPQLREYHIFKMAMQNGTTDDLDAWGFFSTRWKAKTRLEPKQFTDWVEANPGYDVYHVNPSRVHEACTINVWEQGDWYHKGLKEAGQSILYDLGYVVDLNNMPMSREQYCFCSYFVASKAFWQDYMKFLDDVFRYVNVASPEIQKLVAQNANYGKDRTLNNFPFIVERLFPTFLYMNRTNYNVAYYPYEYDFYKPQISEFADFVRTLSSLKHHAIKLKDKKLFDQWDAIRKHFIERYFRDVSIAEDEQYYYRNLGLDPR
jgi:hypothetical protein